RELTGDSSVLAALSLKPPAGAGAEMTGPAPEYIAGKDGLNPHASGPKHDDLVAAEGRSRDWPMPEHDYSGTRYSPLSQITSANVSRLRAVCLYQVGENGSFQTAPIVDRGTMYITIEYVTIALDAVTCRPKWRYAWSPRDKVTGVEVSTNRGV